MTILWDWNGTLLDDTQASIDALNVQLVRRGLAPVTRESYRQRFAFPVRSYYAELGVDLAHEDWEALAQNYHDVYHAQPVALNGETVAALKLAQSMGCRQCLVSALRQDYLDAAVDRYGLRSYFSAVIGTDNLDGGSKLARARVLVERLRQEADGKAPDLVMIGDALHDAEVARTLGVRCVLFSGGSHAPERLRPAAPTADTLTACVRLAAV